MRDFNAIVLKLNEEELALFGERIFFVERKLKPGIDKLTWASKPQILQTYAKDCRRYCNEVYQTAIKFKANHRTIMENCRKMSAILAISIEHDKARPAPPPRPHPLHSSDPTQKGGRFQIT